MSTTCSKNSKEFKTRSFETAYETTFTVFVLSLRIFDSIFRTIVSRAQCKGVF